MKLAIIVLTGSVSALLLLSACLQKPTPPIRSASPSPPAVSEDGKAKTEHESQSDEKSETQITQDEVQSVTDEEQTLSTATLSTVETGQSQENTLDTNEIRVSYKLYPWWKGKDTVKGTKCLISTVQQKTGDIHINTQIRNTLYVGGAIRVDLQKSYVFNKYQGIKFKLYCRTFFLEAHGASNIFNEYTEEKTLNDIEIGQQICINFEDSKHIVFTPADECTNTTPIIFYFGDEA